MTHLAGTRALTLAALRRDRVRLSAWMLALVGFVAWMPRTFMALFQDEAEVATWVGFYALNPVMRLFGLASGATLPAFFVTRTHIMFAIAIALMSAFLVLRHTRQEEDLGRTELVGALPVGRHAFLASALCLALGANLFLALLFALTLILHGWPAVGALATGASLGGMGLAFAGIAAIAAQLSSTARAASGLTMLALGAAYLLAGLGNILGTLDPDGVRVHSHLLAWLSPLGWSQQVRPFAGDHLWPVLLLALFFGAAVAAAWHLNARRDVGQGLLPQRPGPATAAPNLSGPGGLAWRLQRGAFFSWMGGLAFLALVYGATSREVEGLLEGMDAFVLTLMGGADALVEGYLTMVTGLLGVLAAAYALQTTMRMRTEETEGRLEELLATAVGRGRWMWAHVANASFGLLAVLTVTGLSLGLTTALVMGAPSVWVPALLVAALAQAPAALVFVGGGAALFGLVPRFADGLAWGAFAVAVVTGPMFGPLLELPPWALDLSPFSHVPAAPREAIAFAPLAALCLAAAVLLAAGLLCFRHRDIDA